MLVYPYYSMQTTADRSNKELYLDLSTVLPKMKTGLMVSSNHSWLKTQDLTEYFCILLLNLRDIKKHTNSHWDWNVKERILRQWLIMLRHATNSPFNRCWFVKQKYSWKTKQPYQVGKLLDENREFHTKITYRIPNPFQHPNSRRFKENIPVLQGHFECLKSPILQNLLPESQKRSPKLPWPGLLVVRIFI